jgi:tRNA(His) guanylyltransferase
MSHSDDFGDRMKSYEAPTTSRVAFKGQPLVVRLDGKSFHTFTKGLARPYDQRLSDLMVDTTKALVDRFHASVGYCQSDEITLAWYHETNSDSEYPFKGRLQKIESLTAAFCSVFFATKLAERIPEKAHLLPTFDARAFSTPTLVEAYNAFLWRQQDCTKNAISMAAQSMFTHKSLSGLKGPQMQERMWSEKGINFNDYPPGFKRGTFVKKVRTLRPLTDEEMAKIPTRNLEIHPKEVIRSSVESMDIWLGKHTNSGVNILFNGELPVYDSDFK